MAPADSDDRGESLSYLASIVERPDESRERLPSVVGLLDADDQVVRLAAASALVVVGTADTDRLDYIIRRLVDRLHDETARPEALYVFEYLTTQFAEDVDETLQELREEMEREPLAYSRPEGYKRSEYYVPSRSSSRPGVGRTRLVGEDVDAGPQRVYSSSRPRNGPPMEPTERTDQLVESDDGADEERDENQAKTGLVAVDDSVGKPLMLSEERLADIVSQSAFSEITVLTGGDWDRYAEVYRALAMTNGVEQAVAIRAFHEPEDELDVFFADLADTLEMWETVADHDNVLTLHEWGRSLGPWAATAYSGLSLADRDPFTPGVALWNAIQLADAVSHAHQRGVVHGGLDPRNVVYTGDVLDDSPRQAPLLANVGLMHTFRFYFEPAMRLDPRYAAPEYYEREFGTIDHATDIYQLGTVLYRLFTGRPPFTGDFSEVRNQVLADQPVPPSEQAEGLPPGLDDVIAKATAKQKLTRYETVDHLKQELQRIFEGES